LHCCGRDCSRTGGGSGLARASTREAGRARAGPPARPSPFRHACARVRRRAKTVRDFIDELERRFGSTGNERRGVHLLTLHGAKGLEFMAVFIPRVEERELPIKLARTEVEIAEERRLLYVGMTRAKRHLALTWSGRPSRFLRELGVEAPVVRRERAPEPDDPLYTALKRWRFARAAADEQPAYVVFHNATLAEIAARRPR